MNYTIEAAFSFSEKDRAMIDEKMGELEKYEPRITQVKVYFKQDDGQENQSILAEIEVRVPGKDLFAKNTDADAIKAFSLAYNAVKKQLLKRRDINKDHRSDIKNIL